MILKNTKDNLNAKDLIIAEDLDRFGISHSFLREHYSASFINSWKECPDKTLINNLDNGEVPALMIGSAVHELLEKKYSENISEDDIIKMVNKYDMDDFYKCDVREYLRAYFKMKPYKEFAIEPTYLCEEEVISEVSPLGVKIPVKMKGYIDRLDLTEDGTYIIDYKTASRKPYEDKYIDQMILYKWIIEEKYGLDVAGVYVASIFKEDPKYIEQEITLKKQSKLIDKIFDVDEEVQESLKDKSYIKRKGDHCRWCALKNVCDSSCDVSFDGNKLTI